MKLTDILPVEKWIGLEKEINKRSGIDATIYNKDGISITSFKKWANRLCPVVKANKKGLSFICAVANQNMTRQAIQTRHPVVAECDAGLGRLVVPIFVGDEFLGTAGGCGMIIDDSEVEFFLINKITGIDEKEIERLSVGINKMTTDEVETVTKYVEERIREIINDFEKNGRIGLK